MERIGDSPPSANPTGVPVPKMDLIVSELRGGGGGGGKDTTSFLEQEEDSGLDHPAGKLEPMKWTNEKHSQYLKSMEASFVDQLHDSLDLLGWHSQKYASSQREPCSQKLNSRQDPSGEFKVFRDGWLSKINFSRGKAELKKEDESDQISSKPDIQSRQISSSLWIQRHKSGCRQHLRTSPTFQEELSANMKEVTDQNFLDEDGKEEGTLGIGMQSSKRMKTRAFAGQD